jgi:oxygen-independent coproporphyrinogen-3 oxidase
MDERWFADPVECGTAAGFGIYVHIPFCAHRCGYCDFATYDDKQDWIPRYVAALRAEIARAGGSHRPVTSIFIGGGTPTLLPTDDLAGVVDLLHDTFEVEAGAEVTVECNPETASVDLFERLAGSGVNRVSMGAQSFSAEVLATLERQHTPQRPLEAVAEARRGGIDQVSLDLIYGTPGETDADWEATLRQALTAGVDHVSAYALTIHDNTPFGRRVNDGTLARPDDDVQADRFDVARDLLGAAGFEHYEISNWAMGSHARSRHNVLYWRHGDYLAFGVGAHGHRDGRRWWNPRAIAPYVAAVEEGRDPAAGSEVLAPDERAEERLLLGLRLREGLHPADVPPIDPLALEDAMANDLVQTSCGRLQSTDRGWFLLDEAVRRLT